MNSTNNMNHINTLDDLDVNNFSEQFPELINFDDNNWLEYIIIILIVIVIVLIYYVFGYDHQGSEKFGLISKNNPLIEYINDAHKTNRNIIGLLEICSKKYPDKSALVVRKNIDWISVNYEDYFNNVKQFAESLSYWIGPKCKVAIVGFNSPAWFYAHLGSIANNSISIGIYSSSTSTACEYILNNANIDVLVLDDDVQLDKFIDTEMKNIKLILYY